MTISKEVFDNLSPVILFAGLSGLILGGIPGAIKKKRFGAYIGAILSGVLSIFIFFVFTLIFEWEFWPYGPLENNCTLRFFAERCADDFFNLESFNDLFWITGKVFAGATLGCLNR